MAYEVLARKWRPQQFSDVVGQNHVVRTLTNAIETGRVAHAYIFVGSRGIGKTTSARILAKALNCEKGPTPQPCDACDSCREIMLGNSLDVIEIDGASNNGVDQVRELRENACYAPARGPFKIYIIDEVHMLSTGAFNALLKTLEEPPAHVKFLFATTDVHKVPATILSRCQRFDLRRISLKDIVDRLRRGCAEEGVEISEDALLAIARGAEGGLRDAESALDQLISFRGKKIEEEDVLSVFGLLSRKTLNALAEAVVAADVPAIIRLVAEMDRSGKDLRRVVLELMELFRDLLVTSHAGDDLEALEVPEGRVPFYRELGAKIQTGRVLRIMDALVEADARLRYALSPRTLLETGLIRCARVAETVAIDELLKQLAELKKNAGFPAPETSVAAGGQASSRASEDADEKKKPHEDELARLLLLWRKITDHVAKADPLSKSYFLDTAPVGWDGARLTVGFDPEFESERERFDSSRTQLALGRAVDRALDLGRLPAVVFRPLREGDPRPPADRLVESSPPAGSPSAPPGPSKWYAHPIVKEVVEIFNGEIVDVRG